MVSYTVAYQKGIQFRLPDNTQLSFNLKPHKNQHKTGTIHYNRYDKSGGMNPNVELKCQMLLLISKNRE